jgi:hypothetical protein
MIPAHGRADWPRLAAGHHDRACASRMRGVAGEDATSPGRILEGTRFDDPDGNALYAYR